MNIDGTVGSKYQTAVVTRPYDFGTDAIERQRVSLGQSIIDADFEYGLQATKWQSYSDVRKFPSFYEIPGTDIASIGGVAATINGASTTSNIITVATSTPPVIGSVVVVSGLDNSDKTANRAEGFFIVSSNVASTSFSYVSKGVVATPLGTSYTVIRRGGIYNNQTCNVQVQSLTSASTLVTVVTKAAHGLVPGTPITATGWNGTGANVNSIISVTDATTFTYPITGGSVGPQTGGSVYIQPYSYTIHRPFDGGVIMSPNIPTHGASVVRQSKKVFRYQSGKGLLWSSGTLFCPNNDIASLTFSAGVITVTTSIPHGAPQAGAIVQIRGVTSPGYNGNYTVATVIGDTVLTLNTTATGLAATAVLGDQPRFVMTNWHGACVRAGCFDDQNGIFWEYDGQTLWAVKRSCTFQLAGLVYTTKNSQSITGVNSRFAEQLKVNDRVTIRGMTYQVTGITNNTSMTVNPPYRGSADIASTAPVTMCKVREIRTPQSEFNRDTIDGRGPSGYRVDLSKMQMIGIQYTWYGAGFIDFMIRGSDGNWLYVHRYRQNNINDEAYMRTGNLPVRYEICNESVSSASTLALALSSGTAGETIALNDSTTYWPPTGTVLIDQELISYTGKTATGLTGLGRAASLSYNIADTNSTFTGGAASAHLASNSVNLISCTCSPSLTHWGSAFLMDGNFDQDRGYFFNYQVNSSTATLAPLIVSGSTLNLFMLRLAPSVSNGIVGDMGIRDLMNRAQLLLQRLDVFGGSNVSQVSTTSGAISGSIGSLVVSGILNPSGLSVSSWTAINSTAQGSQPSFAQVAPGVGPGNVISGTYTAGSGERIFSTISNSGQNSIDLSNLKEVCNGVIGGNGFFPDGPDTLLVQASVPAGFPPINSYSVNLFWTEAQA
jgi:hypothetical protein